MIVVKFIQDKKYLIRPKNHIELFLHCSGGQPHVTNREFEDVVWPLLTLHGIHKLETIKD